MPSRNANRGALRHCLTVSLCWLGLTAVPGAASEAIQGVFGTYTGLVETRAIDGAPVLRYRAPGLQPGAYRQIIIDPVQTGPRGEIAENVDDALLREMVVNLHSQLRHRVGERVTLTRTPGPGTARLRTAITGATLENQSLRPRNLIPLNAVISVLKVATDNWDQEMYLRLEGQLVDSVTGELLVVGIRTDRAENLSNVRSDATYEDVRGVVDNWADSIAQGLGAAMSRDPAP